jgi:hypothetical protein
MPIVNRIGPIALFRLCIEYSVAGRGLGKSSDPRSIPLTLSRPRKPISPFNFKPVVWLGGRYSTDNQAVQQSSFY